MIEQIIKTIQLHLILPGFNIVSQKRNGRVSLLKLHTIFLGLLINFTTLGQEVLPNSATVLDQGRITHLSFMSIRTTVPGTLPQGFNVSQLEPTSNPEKQFPEGYQFVVIQRTIYESGDIFLNPFEDAADRYKNNIQYIFPAEVSQSQENKDVLATFDKKNIWYVPSQAIYEVAGKSIGQALAQDTNYFARGLEYFDPTFSCMKDGVVISSYSGHSLRFQSSSNHLNLLMQRCIDGQLTTADVAPAYQPGISAPTFELTNQQGDSFNNVTIKGLSALLILPPVNYTYDVGPSRDGQLKFYLAKDYIPVVQQELAAMGRDISLYVIALDSPDNSQFVRVEQPVPTLTKAETAKQLQEQLGGALPVYWDALGSFSTVFSNYLQGETTLILLNGEGKILDAFIPGFVENKEAMVSDLARVLELSGY